MTWKEYYVSKEIRCFDKKEQSLSETENVHSVTSLAGTNIT